MPSIYFELQSYQSQPIGQLKGTRLGNTAICAVHFRHMPGLYERGGKVLGTLSSPWKSVKWVSIPCHPYYLTVLCTVSHGSGSWIHKVRKKDSSTYSKGSWNPRTQWLETSSHYHHTLTSAWSQLDNFFGVVPGVWSAVWSQRRLRFDGGWDAAPLTTLSSPALAFSASCCLISLC